MYLLQQTPRLIFLITSRERLNIPGEWVLNLGALKIPPPDQGDPSVQDFSAVQLFVQSARQIRPEFELDEANRHNVAQICRLVQGMPMAIVLAASWLRLLSCQEIVAELTPKPGTAKGLDFLSIIASTMPDYGSGVREVFDRSWVMLSDAEQRVFRQLAVCRGGFDRQASQVIAGATLESLLSLADKSLLLRVDEGRFDYHDLLRQYAFEKLVGAGEFTAAAQAHLEFYSSQAELNEAQWVKSRNLASFLWFIREQANLWAAFDWARSEGSSINRASTQHLQRLIHQDWYRDGVHRLDWGK
jgi:predicted ATPase